MKLSQIPSKIKNENKPVTQLAKDMKRPNYMKYQGKLKEWGLM
jgi:hypothetical protein